MSLRTRVRRFGGRMLAAHVAARPKARVLAFVSRSRILTRLWYLPRRAYLREQQAMLAGIAAYHEAEADFSRGPLYRLRRDVHRIEKGLCVPSRRPTFAEGYIGDTVDAFEKVVATRNGTANPTIDTTIAWASDVLHEYFAGVTATPPVADAAQRFERVEAPAVSDGTRVPKPKENGQAPVPYDAIAKLARRRRSVRAFLPEPVPREVIDSAVEVARQAPSACNRQAFEFRVYDDPEMIRGLVDLAPGFDDNGRAVPCMIAVVGKYRAYFRERDMHVIYIDASLATMGLLFGLETLGYASCCINWPSIPDRDRRLADYLRLDPDEEVIMLVAVGKADGEVSSPYSEKAPLDAVRSFNRR